MNFDVKPFDFVHNIALLSSAAQPRPLAPPTSIPPYLEVAMEPRRVLLLHNTLNRMLEHLYSTMGILEKII
jgi:hypothetical protein